MLLVALAYVVLSGRLAAAPVWVDDRGYGLPGVGALGLSPLWSAIVNAAANLGIMAMMVMVNKAYNVLRAITWLMVGLFALMQAAVPVQCTTLNPGTLLCLCIALCTYMMLGCYGQPGRTRTVFLVFLILGAGCAVQYAFTPFILVFWLMLVQMRIFSARTFLASLLGILCAWILLLGSGTVSPADITWPHLSGLPDDIGLNRGFYRIAVATITALLLLGALMANAYKTISYNARARAYNGALVVLALVTVIAMALDSDNLATYLPLLNMSAAYQITHYFVNHRYDRQYIAVLAIAGVYVALYIWRILP